MAWCYQEYLEERVDELFESKEHADFVQDMMIHYFVDYNLSALTTEELREAAFSDCVGKVKVDLADKYNEMFENEWDELQAEYRADMIVDLAKDMD